VARAMVAVTRVLLLYLTYLVTTVSPGAVHSLHWNSTNPIFRIDNTDHIVDVNLGNLPWEYDQLNIICPTDRGTRGMEDGERYIIYNVSKEEYDSCRISQSDPRVVAVCDKPDRKLSFTITFRSFSPTPRGLEFRPGQDYYFISTSSRRDLHRRVGGSCSSHNMKVIFKVAPSGEEAARLHELISSSGSDCRGVGISQD
jgi:ephrin-B